MNVAAVRKAMAEALDFDGVNVSPYASSQPVTPGIQIIPPAVSFDYTFGTTSGLDEWTFIIQGFVALNEDVTSQMLLDELCGGGANSVKAALELDRTLGGAVANLRVVEQSPGRLVDRGGGQPMLLVEWRVMVYANGA